VIKKKADSINLLDIVPVKSAEWETRDNKLITILRPKFSNKIFKKYILPRMKKPCYKIYLDEFGSFVWSQCDGAQTVEEIGGKLQKEFGEDVEPVYDRLGTYIRQLHKARFITLPAPPGSEDSNR